MPAPRMYPAGHGLSKSDQMAYGRSFADGGNGEYGVSFGVSTMELGDDVMQKELQHFQARFQVQCPNLLRIISNSPNSDSALVELKAIISKLESITEELKEERRKSELMDVRVRQVLEKLAEKKSQVTQLQKEKGALEQRNALLEETGASLGRKLMATLDRYKTATGQPRHQKPLVDIGAAIRRRFLEKAATNAAIWGTVHADRDYPPDAAIIEAGNAAAHQGNMEADIALFKCGLVHSKEVVDKFDAIYWSPHDLDWFPYMHRTALLQQNLMATVRSSADKRALYNGRQDRFGVHQFLGEIPRLVREIQTLQPSAFDSRRYRFANDPSLEVAAESFDEDPDVEEKGARLKELVEKVVKIVWRKGGVQL